MKYLLTIFCFFHLWSFGLTKTGTITVEVKNFRNIKGNIMLSMYQNADGFPSKPEKAFKKFIVPIKSANFEYNITDVPEGTFAVAIIHDENADSKMESNFIGMPKEGIGTSNNTKGNFGPPKFDDAKFSFNGTSKKITINLVYL